MKRRPRSGLVKQPPTATATAPHCDPRILHEPSSCEYCDLHPEWQEARRLWGINFTGHNDADKLPCPADLARPAGSAGDHRRWGGNVAGGELPPVLDARSYEDNLDEQLRRLAESRRS